MYKEYLININEFKNTDKLKEAVENASSFRLEKYNAYKNEVVKLESIAGAYLIDKYLKTVGFCEKDMKYELTKAGKPYFINRKDIKFNISHSDGLVYAVFSDKEIGCDIQVVRDSVKEIYNRVLSDKEKEEVVSIFDENKQKEKFIEYWVKKEAYVKCIGTGISDDMTNIDVKNISARRIEDNKKIYYIAVCENSHAI